MTRLPPAEDQFSKRPHEITPQAIEAFVAGDMYRLHRALNLTPWNFSPLMIEGLPPSWVERDAVLKRHWTLAQDLRGKLERATRQ